MEFDAVLRRRRMVRNYTDKAVDPSLLEQIVANLQRTPSAGNCQGVSWVVVQSAEKRRQIAELAGEEEWVARGYPGWLSGAPIHVVLCAEPQVYHERYSESDKSKAVSTPSWPVPYWYIDAGACLMVLLESAVDKGLAAGFQGIQNLAGLDRLLGIPESVIPIGVVTLGYPADDRRGTSANRPKRARTHWENWQGGR